MPQILDRLYKSRTSKYAAILLLAVVINFVLAPMSVVFLQPKTAQAQSELMMPLMIMTMIFQMISSLMQMGGGQQGGGEEQPPQNAGTVGPSNSGPQNSGDPSASASPSTTSTLCDKTVFLAGSGTSFTIAPATVTIKEKSCVNILNATTDTSKLLIRIKDQTTGTEKDITTSKMEIFNFATKGIYEICQKVGEVLSCKATVTVE
jgi:hypothetical protein